VPDILDRHGLTAAASRIQRVVPCHLDALPTRKELCSITHGPAGFSFSWLVGQTLPYWRAFPGLLLLPKMWECTITLQLDPGGCSARLAVPQPRSWLGVARESPGPLGPSRPRSAARDARDFTRCHKFLAFITFVGPFLLNRC
jgi:hypothetical protein